MFDDLMTKPFKDLARGPDAYDCYGLAIEVCKRLDRNLPDFGSVVSDNIAAIRQKVVTVRSSFKEIKKPRAGDIVLMRTAPGRPSHIGVAIGGGQFIQIRRETGVYISDLNHPLEKGRIAGFYRYE